VKSDIFMGTTGPIDDRFIELNQCDARKAACIERLGGFQEHERSQAHPANSSCLRQHLTLMPPAGMRHQCEALDGVIYSIATRPPAAGPAGN
jgi:hypothetical protein